VQLVRVMDTADYSDSALSLDTFSVNLASDTASSADCMDC